MTHIDPRPTAETISQEQLDALHGKLDALERCYSAVAGDASAHRFCAMTANSVLRRAEAAEEERAELAARVKAVENAAVLRDCLVPTCFRQFDVNASLDSRVPRPRPEWSGEGWRQVRAGMPLTSGYVCPDHDGLVVTHMPKLLRSSDSDQGIHVSCTCGGWETEGHVWHQVARALWEQHLLQVAGKLPPHSTPDQDRAAAARALHKPMKQGPFVICAYCSDWDGRLRCRGLVKPWPCASVAALDGTEPGRDPDDLDGEEGPTRCRTTPTAPHDPAHSAHCETVGCTYPGCWPDIQPRTERNH